jgi:hypothetical protein
LEQTCKLHFFHFLLKKILKLKSTVEERMNRVYGVTALGHYRGSNVNNRWLLLRSFSGFSSFSSFSSFPSFPSFPDLGTWEGKLFIRSF